MHRERHSNGSAFEAAYGYCRAVRAGPMVFVSGTTAPAPDLEVEFAAAAARIAEALQALGSSMDDVVRTVVYVRDLSQVDAIAAAHRRAFGQACPASTVVEVARLTPPEARLEIEATAVIAGP